jgi:hypothetical protein
LAPALAGGLRKARWFLQPASAGLAVLRRIVKKPAEAGFRKTWLLPEDHQLKLVADRRFALTTSPNAVF